MFPVSLLLFGPLRFTNQDQSLYPSLWIKSQALLAYLAVESGLPHRRQMLAGLLWPDFSEEAARASLRQALHQIRTVLGTASAVLTITPQTVQWNPGSAFCDAAEFLTLLSICKNHAHFTSAECPECLERCQKIVDLYRHDLLADFSLKDSIAFEEWLMVKREQFRQLALEILETLTHAYEIKGDYDQMEKTARRQVEIDPFRESAHRQVMRALAWNKHRSQALIHFNSLSTLLKKELGVEAESSTISLSKRILSEQIHGREKTSPPASSSQSSWYNPRTGMLTRTAFVNRKKELADLETWFQKAHSGKGQVGFVVGEAGSGKTELLNQFVRRTLSAQDDVVVVNASGMAYAGIGDPFHPFCEILRKLTGDIPVASPGSLDQELFRRQWRQIPFLCQALLDTAPGLVGTFLSGTSLVKNAVEAFRVEGEVDPPWLPSLRGLVESKTGQPVAIELPLPMNLFEQYVRLLKTLARRHPLLLVLDDVQWLDEGSAGLLFYLAKQISNSRILLIGAYRPSEVILGNNGEFHLEQAQGPRNHHEHPLEPILNELKRNAGGLEISLDQDGQRVFIDELLDSSPNRLDAKFRDSLFQHTQAYPLFTTEFLGSMQERGDLIRDSSGYWVASPSLNWEALPRRVEAVFAEQVRRLPGALLEMLNLASLEGDIFTAEVLARAAQKEVFEIIQLLSNELGRQRRLVLSEKVFTIGDQAISQYRFRHRIFKRYLYQCLDPAERNYLQRKIKEAGEFIYGIKA